MALNDTIMIYLNLNQKIKIQQIFSYKIKYQYKIYKIKIYIHIYCKPALKIIPLSMSNPVQFQIKCQCSVFKQNFNLHNNKKSKFSVIVLDLNEKILKILPYQPTAPRNTSTPNNQKQKQNDNKNQPAIIKLQFLIRKLRMIHKKYIEQGKITLQFIDSYETKVIKGLDVSVEEKKQQIIVTVMISNASKENLQLLIQKIMILKKKIKDQDDAKEKSLKQIQKKKTNDSLKVQQIQKPLKDSQAPNRTRYPTLPKGRQNSPPKMSRKQMIQQAICPQKFKPKRKIQFQQEAVNKIILKRTQLFDLPSSIIKNIFEYVQVSLRMRLVSKQFSNFVIKNMKSLKFRDQVDEETFNKLAQFTTNIECRMKNIKNMSLFDQNDDQILIKNKAKSLKFGNWKEMSFKNIQQIKHLRLYCLQIPYSMKFDFNYLLGLRLVQLRLKGNNIQTRNPNVRDQSVLKFVQICRDIRCLEIAHASTKFLLGLGQLKQRFEELKIMVLNIVTDDLSWTDFTEFPKLRKFGIQQILKQGVTSHLNINIKLPQELTHCEIGQYLSHNSFENLPKNLYCLKINGEKFNTQDLLMLPLCNLKQLDISECSSIGGDGFHNMQYAKVITSWQKQTIKSCQQRYTMRNIKFYSTRYL